MLAYERRSTSVLRIVWQLECLRGHVNVLSAMQLLEDSLG